MYASISSGLQVELKVLLKNKTTKCVGVYIIEFHLKIKIHLSMKLFSALNAGPISLIPALSEMSEAKRG